MGSGTNDGSGRGQAIRRWRSGAVALGVVGGLAAALTACDSSPDRRCVDTTVYKNVADKLCKAESDGGYGDADRYQWFQKGGSSTYLPGYHRYYGSTRSRSGSGGSGSDDSGSGTHHSVTRGGLGGHSGSHSGS